MRYTLWKALATSAKTQYVTINGYQSMLQERFDEKHRAKRFAKTGLSSYDTFALGAWLMKILTNNNIFDIPGCNCYNIYKMAYEHLGFTSAMTESAIETLLVSGVLEHIPCDIPQTVHPYDLYLWQRLEPTK